MSPAVIAAILSLVEEAIAHEPQLAADLKDIFSKPNPQPSDWQTLRGRVLLKGYKDYVPQSALPGTPASSPA